MNPPSPSVRYNIVTVCSLQLIKFQNDRGGRVQFANIAAPEVQEWASPKAAMEYALQYERMINGQLLKLHELADKHHDYYMTDFLEGMFWWFSGEGGGGGGGVMQWLARRWRGHGGCQSNFIVTSAS